MSSSPGLDWTELDQKAVDTARVLAMDAVQKVGNGHPGTAMSLAPAAYLLFQKVMCGTTPRTRTGPGVTASSSQPATARSRSTRSSSSVAGASRSRTLMALRTWGSKTPGHPEHGHTSGVDDHRPACRRRQRGRHGAGGPPRAWPARPERRRGRDSLDHHIYAICSDGDMQEGVSAEASSFAGTQELGNLTVIYDANRISIEGGTDIAFTEDVGKRYEAYGWHVQTVDWTHDGTHYAEDVPQLYAAIRKAQDVTDRPHRAAHDHRLAGTERAEHRRLHVPALGDDEVAATKKILASTRAEVRGPAGGHRVHPAARRARQAGRGRGEDLPALGGQEVGRRRAVRAAADPHPARRLGRRPPELRGRPEGRRDLQGLGRGHQRDRRPGARAVGRLGRPRRVQQHHDQGRPVLHPEESRHRVVRDPLAGRVLHFGIREHAMGAIPNGVALHGGTRGSAGPSSPSPTTCAAPSGSRRLAQLPVTYVWTHDSIGLGEDGPTHQPIEHLAALRAIPASDVVRPADANEVAAVWKTVLERPRGPPASR